MEHAVELSVRMRADANCGETWHDAKG